MRVRVCLVGGAEGRMLKGDVWSLWTLCRNGGNGATFARRQQQQHLIYSSESLKEPSGIAPSFLEERKSLQCLRKNGLKAASCESNDI